MGSSSFARFKAAFFVTSITLTLTPSAYAIDPLETLAEITPARRLAEQCQSLLMPVIDLIDAAPFTRKILNRRLSKSWVEHFNPNIYIAEKNRYLEMENMGLDRWGLPESDLAYLSALIQRATGVKLTLADMFIEDPTHARKLQILTRSIDFSENLTRHKLREVLENAFMLTGKLELKFSDLATMNTARAKSVMREYAEMEMAKYGVVNLYRDFGLLRKPTLSQKLHRMATHPITMSAILIPTWTVMTAKWKPGLLPKIQWVRFSEEEMIQMLSVGYEEYLRIHPEFTKKLGRSLRFQKTYDYLRNTVAIWAGAFTFGYAIAELSGHDDDDIRNWVRRQIRYATAELRREAKLPDNSPGDP